MEALGMAIVVTGGIIAIIGGIRLVLAAFRSSILWGVAVLFVQPLTLVYILFNWSDAKGPLVNYLTGVALMSSGVLVAGG